ncbi:exodeoxyribonuclease III [Legionella clemsonensis]|uniref:Exodeoxyribonuclease III n=1 Tax=Legionella clemsonensis TaxID=1867846 RepID=A0A222NZJ6_9GAMM|nr:exodeoxyribonuclease III [Legionella clemsonensis]ASQ45008.1 Exodeoxyribonuclease III [Legionella clemsonensis]
MLKIASWNVNSIKIRLEQVLNWLQSTDIHVLAMQETKLVDELFPVNIFTELGYHVAFTGQKSYNGVALVSQHPLSDIVKELPDFEDTQRRVLAATIGDIRFVNLYVPNGSDLASEKYSYKLAWLEKTKAFIKQQLTLYPKLVVLGDFNIAPEDKDVHDPLEWQNCVMVSPAERQAFADLLALGLTDTFRNFPQEEQSFTWWDYRAGAFRRNRGLRIDHILLSAELNCLCTSSKIDKIPRKWERPSDHAPIWVEISD